jgi:hypothetical protein
MDKIIIITDFRAPKKGDKFVSDSAWGVLTASYNYEDNRNRFIVGAEIEVPEGANRLTVQMRGRCNTPPAIHIDLPRKTVKKWMWERDYLYSDMKVVTKTHS